MTEKEKKKSAQFGAITGVFVAIFFVIPLSFGLVWAFENKSTIAIFVIILWVLIGIPTHSSALDSNKISVRINHECV